MIPHRGNTFLFRSSQQLPRLRLGPFEGLFELNSPCALLPKLQRHKTLSGASRGGPNTPSKPADTNLGWAFAKTLCSTDPGL